MKLTFPPDGISPSSCGMTTPTSSIASVPVTIPSPPPSAAQGPPSGSTRLHLIVGVVMVRQLVMVLVGIIWDHSLVTGQVQPPNDKGVTRSS